MKEQKKKGFAAYLFSIVVFVLFLGLLGASVFNYSFTITSTNSTQGNVSIVTAGGFQNINVPTCSGGAWDSIPVISLGSCIAAHVGFYFTLITLETNILWLAPVFLGVGIVIGYIAVRVIRAGG